MTALIHDVLLVVGAFAIFQWTFNLPELAALLGGDRLLAERHHRGLGPHPRELPRHAPRYARGDHQLLAEPDPGSDVGDLVDHVAGLGRALCSREASRCPAFATALAIGVVVGTYSSIYVAANVLLAMGISKQDLALPDKEDAA